MTEQGLHEFFKGKRILVTGGTGVRLSEIQLLELYATSGHIFAAFRTGNSLSH